MNAKISLNRLLRAATSFITEAVVELVTEALNCQEDTIRQEMKFVRVTQLKARFFRIRKNMWLI